MTSQPAGWYHDPNDPSQLRYWDGVLWSSHVVPSSSPTVAQSTIGLPRSVPPAAARRGTHPHVAQPPAGGRGPGAGSAQSQGGGQAPDGQPQQYQPYQPFPGGQEFTTQVHLGRPVARTVDGVQLSGWWRRVGARVVDWLAVTLLALPLTWSSYQEVMTLLATYIERVWDAGYAGSTAPALPMDAYAGPATRASLITFAVYAVYEIGLIGAFGATLGKRVVGISVRRADRPGPPPWGHAALRFLFKDLSRLVGVVPVISLLGSVFSVLDSLWPLWDGRKQSLHDKVAGTQVVLGQQLREPSNHPPNG